MRIKVLASSLILLLSAAFLFGQSKSNPSDKFRQLDELLPAPNVYRTASGAPGHKYWQQRADYVINVEIDDVNQRLIGKETITYKNMSPDTLDYIWVQLDQNLFAMDSDTQKTNTAPGFDGDIPFTQLEQLAQREYDGKVNISSVRDPANNPLRHVVVNTMMRIDPPKAIAPGESFVFKIDWDHKINNHRIFGGRGGYEYFSEDGNFLYEIAQWFPRMAAYYDVHGWQHHQFLGRGEFTLEFGDYDVKITVPNDHVVGS
ncbi:MAG: aminopeptidase, partial [Acidobacteriota bacterium]|nr:aminopeptidase [Acidobacteriota bacterium]